MTRCLPFRLKSANAKLLPTWLNTARWRHLALLAIVSCALSQSPASAADDSSDDSQVPDGPWISSVAWQDANTILGTRSQSLLFRPAEVVRAKVDALQDLQVVGESESALWAVVPLADGSLIASDYRGGVHLFTGSEATSGDSKSDDKSDLPSNTKSFELDARWIRSLAATPNSQEVLAGTEDGKLIVLSIEQTKESRRIDAHAAAIFDIAFSVAGDKVATAAGDGSIKIFSWPELEPQGEMKVGKDAIWSLVFVNNDQQIVSGGADRAIQLWDVASASSVVTIASAHNWITSVVALPKSNLVAAAGMDGNVVVVNFKTMQAVTSQEVAGSGIWSAALSPDGKQLALGTRKHGLALVDVQAWRKAGRAAAQQAQAIRPPAPKKPGSKKSADKKPGKKSAGQRN